MDVFIPILVLIGAGLLATSRPAYRLRRSRPATVLVAGGWVSVLVGVVLGPSVTGLIDRESIFNAVPLLALGLGWIGMLVGLQFRWSLLRSLPRAVWLIAAADFLVSAAVFGTLGYALLSRWLPEPSPALLTIPLVFLVAGSLGWSVETRSLGAHFDRRPIVLVRAAGALAGGLAILAFGVATKLVSVDALGALSLTPDRAALKLLHSVLLALAIGFVGRGMIRLAGSSQGHQFTVFLGLVAFIAGSANQLDCSPLITAMCTGAVIANIRSQGIQQFEAFIFRAEHTFAILFGLLTGLLLEPVTTPLLLLGALAFVAARIVFKPLVMGFGFRSVRPEWALDRHAGMLPLLRIGACRQAPLMLALGVSLVLVEPSTFHKELLGLLVLVGIASELMPAIFAWRAHIKPDDPADEERPA
ncbi:MAG: hypothetical protein AAGD00_06870 [Planctomycetota bacterium]